MILARVALRNLRRHPWQSILSMVGIALGVSVVIAIDITNESARRAFQISNEVVAGRATHHIVAGPVGLDEDLYRMLRVEHGLRRTAPVVRGWVRLADRPSVRFQLLGIDPFADISLPAYGRSGADWDPTQLLSVPHAVVMLDATARQLAMQAPSAVSVRANHRQHTLRLIATLNSANELEAQALRSLLITDVSTAQQLLGTIGRLNQIDVELVDGRSADEIRGLLPHGAELVTSASRGNALQQMTRAFQLNLTALSLLALVVGMFLIYNTMTISVLQRHRQIATLRTLGVSDRQLFTLVVGEALVLGAAGTLLGIALGVLLSGGLLKLVTQTINDLYFTLEVERVHVSLWSLGKGIVLGLGATLLAALAPAREASRVPPQITYLRSGHEIQARRALRPVVLWSVLIGTLAVGVLALPGGSLTLGFVGLFLAILGFALITPLFLLGTVRLAQPLLSFALGPIGRLAGRAVGANLSRTRIAVAALSVAVAATVGVGVMIASFRSTVEHWLANYLRADIYVSSPDTARDQGIDPGLIERIRHRPGVARVGTGRWVELPNPSGRTQLYVVDVDRNAFHNFQFKHGDSDTAWPRFMGTDSVILSEPYAYHFGLTVGDTLTLRTHTGERRFSIDGVYYDYGSDRGVVVMHRDTYSRHWRDRVITSFAIYLDPNVDSQRFLEHLELSELAGTDLTVRSNRDLRTLSLDVFDRTFAVTNVLRVLAIVIAVIGIFSALMSIQLERDKEFAILRANGVTPRQLWALITTETGLMGFAAGVLALPLGTFLALVLILIINRRSFGWTMQVWLAPEQFGYAVALAVLAGVIAGLYPALRMARTPPGKALRHE